ncbi:hypothetical protein F0562_003663 [Nyssa sinensis]|uniref:Uncharacterized protein n=1 Tax=Nyssa sinensis TaxID=561372 RepID=A0A5J5BWF5_9ASTE|nr:hypothetical protein F0562_003663 [Nyssa sinensis]
MMKSRPPLLPSTSAAVSPPVIASQAKWKLFDSLLFCSYIPYAQFGKVMAAEEDFESSILKSQLSQTPLTWKQEMERSQSQVDVLLAKLIEVKACIQGSEEDAKKDLEVLWRRVKTTATLLSYLKSKARIMAVPHLAHTSCGIKQLDGVGLVDKNGVPLSGWSRSVDLSSFDSPD